MNVFRFIFDGLRWLSAIQRWTAAVTIVLALATFGWIVLIVFGLSSVARSPSEVVINFYQSAQDGDFSEAKNMLTTDARVIVNGMTENEWAQILGDLTQGHTIDELIYLGQRNYGKQAIVGVLQDSVDGEAKTRVELLLKQGRHWRIEWPPGTRRFQETVDKVEAILGAPTPES